MENFNANGCLKGKFDIRDYKLKKKVAMAIQFPTEFICVRMPKVKNQGNVGSCVAHAVSEILEFHDNCEHTLSTNFVYGIHNKLFGSEGPGMYLREACKIVKSYGDPEETFCPGNTEVEKVYSIAEKAFNSVAARNNAFNYKIKEYVRISTEDEIKYALMNYGPVLCCVAWYKDYSLVNNVLGWGKELAGGHAIMIYGWNKTGFICQNSWGENWGDKGSFILPYNYTISEAYSIIPKDSQQDVIKPTRNNLLDIIYKIINFVVNLFVK